MGCKGIDDIIFFLRPLFSTHLPKFRKIKFVKAKKKGVLAIIISPFKGGI